MNDFICSAIRGRRLLEFQYHGQLRVVAPYCHGFTPPGNEVLRAVQLRGAGALGFGKLWKLSELVGLRETGETFAPTDPSYNPRDSAMAQIHCAV
jgi:hypothetical protein